MPDVSTSIKALQAYMDRYSIKHSMQYTTNSGPDRLLVHGDLFVPADLYTSGDVGLPNHMIVECSLTLSGLPITRLPDHLVVGNHLLLHNMALAAVPDTLDVRKSITFARCQVPILPQGFRVRGALTVRDSQLSGLPEGLHVGGPLGLQGTTLARFPQDMHVGGQITPPDGLLDLNAFMQGQPDAVRLCPPRSQHERLHMRRFPDLSRIILALRPMQHLCLQRDPDGRIHAEIEPIR